MSSRNSKAQVGPAKKALALKKAAEAKRPQPAYLHRSVLNAPTHKTSPLAPERISAAHQSQGPPPRLLSRQEVLATVGCTYPTLWKMMRQGKFPRSFVVGGKSKWKSDEVTAWLDALQLRRLKGDE